jgi:nucleotide-binding universal stress UspA family protein
MDIHVATVDPESTLAALRYALDLADVTGGDITVVDVVTPPERDEIVPTDRGEAAGERSREDRSDVDGLVQRAVTGRDFEVVEGATRTLERAADRATEAGYDAETALLYGDPLTALPTFAESSDASVVVAERPTAGWLEGHEEAGGALVDALVDRIPVPVVVVPP